MSWFFIIWLFSADAQPPRTFQQCEKLHGEVIYDNSVPRGWYCKLRASNERYLDAR